MSAYNANDYRLAFAMLRGLNRATASSLLAKVGTEENFFTADEASLRALTLLNSDILTRAYRDGILETARRENAFISGSDITVRYFNDDTYPHRLAQCDDAPAALFTLGGCDLDAAHIISVVGTRHATVYGTETASRIVAELAEKIDDLVVVSGLAYGIDIAAHRAALQAGVPTVAVLAHPLNTIYPPEHRSIAARMASGSGALITEYTTDRKIHRGNFLARNRIIASLADATIVVESDNRGGAMSTARMALAYNREVFAVPGRIGDKYSRGCNSLIASDTAHIYTTADDLIDILGWTRRETQGQQKTLALELTEDQQQLLALISQHPEYTVNDIIVALGKPYSALTDLLFQLEMADLIVAVPGGRYAAVPV